MKRKFSKTLSLLLMLAVLCSVIFAMSITANAASETIWVNKIAMKDGQYLRENDNAVTASRPGSGSDYAYYKDGVLYLYNFDLNWNDTSSWTGGIYTSDSNLIVELNGTNTFTSSVKYMIAGNYNSTLTFRGSGSLTINSSADCAIVCGTMKVTGGTLNVTAAGYAIDASYYTQTGGTVNVTSTKDYEALNVYRDASISGGTLNIKASNATWAAQVELGNMTVSGGTVNISPQTNMAGLVIGSGTYTQTGGKVNLATKGYAGIITTGTGKVTVTGGELKATGNGIGLQTDKADIEIGRCDVIMEGVSTGIDCAGAVTINGNGITRITASQNGISCKSFDIKKTGEFLVSGQYGLAVKSSDNAWTVSSTYATSVASNYQGKDAVPLSNQSVRTAKYFFTREAAMYIAGVPMGYDEYLPKNGKAASTYKLSDNYIHTQSNGDRLEVSFKNCDIAATGTTEAIKADSTIQITGTGTLSITSQSGSAILLSNGSLIMDFSGTVNIKSNTMNGIVLQRGHYVQYSGTVNVESSNGILASSGDVDITRGALNVKTSGIGIICKDINITEGSLDVTCTGSLKAVLLTGHLTYKTGLVALGLPANSSGSNLETLNPAQINNYKRVYIGDHACSGGTATCQTLAQCSLCGKYYGFAADHVWSKTWDVTTKDGHAHKCTTPGCTATSALESHKPGAAATESSEQRCTACNYIITPKLNHTHKTTKVSAVAPTCDKNGNIEYYTCSGCAKIFYDAAATREITDRNNIISSALSHRYADSWTTDATGHWHTCFACGKKENSEKHTPSAAATETQDQVCTVCGYIIAPKLGHTHKIVKVSAVAPTCDKAGNVEYYSCSGCSKIFQDAAATKEITDRNSIISLATGHKFSENWNMDAANHWYACTACGVTKNVENHIPGAEATETTDQICTVCSYVIKKAVSHTHKFSEYWYNDDTAHWKACACGETDSKAAHGDTDGDLACDACDWEMANGATDPTDPADPTDPTDPADPTDPTDPADPTDPTDPADPTDPTKGTEGTTDATENTQAAGKPSDQPSGGNQSGNQTGENDSNSSTLVIVIIVIVVLAAGAVAAFLVIKNKKKT